MPATLTPNKVMLCDERDIYVYMKQAFDGARAELPRLIAERIVNERWDELKVMVSTSDLGPLVTAAMVQVMVEKLKG